MSLVEVVASPWWLLSFAVAAGVSLAVSLLGIALGRGGDSHGNFRALAWLGLCEAGYLLATVPFLAARDHDAALLWARISLVPTPGIMYFLWFLCTRTPPRDRLPGLLRTADRAAMAAAVMVAIWTLADAVWDGGWVVEDVRTLPGTLRRRVLVPGRVGLSFFAASLGLFLAAVVTLCRSILRGIPFAGYLVAGGCLYFLSVIHDFLLVLEVYDGPFLNHLGFLGLYGGFAAFLGRRFAAQHQRLRAALKELRQHRRAAVHASQLRSMGTLAAFVAHELGNDLQVVENIVAAAMGTGSRISGRDLDDLRLALKHMGSVLRGLRRMSRRTEDDPLEPVDLPALVDDAVRLLVPVARRRRVRLSWDPPDVELKVHGRPAELMQLMVNLVANAIDAASEEGRDPTVWIGITAGKEGEVVLDVADNGPGIPSEVMDRIFEPFFTTKPTERGTGIGLAVVDHVVRSHGGRVQAARDSDRTRFTVHLPLAGLGSDTDTT